MKIRRYTYVRGARRLTEPKNLITGMPASNDHNSGRLVLGPDRKLYYTIGDQGNNQFDNFCTPIRSQDLPTATQVAGRDWQTYQGKILRLNTDGSIPADNPTFGGVRSHVFSYGHRNAQGIVFGPGGLLYSVEHGPKSDDELNLIRARRQLRLAARARLPGRPGLHLRQLVALGRRALPGPDLRQLRGAAVRSPAERRASGAARTSSNRSGPSSPCPPTTRSTSPAAVTRRSSAGRRSGRRASTSTPPALCRDGRTRC